MGFQLRRSPRIGLAATPSRCPLLSLLAGSLLLMGCPQEFELDVAAAQGGEIVFEVPRGVRISDFEIRPRLPEPEDASGNRRVILHWSIRNPEAGMALGGQVVREIRFGELPSGFVQAVPPIPLVPGKYYEATARSTNRGIGIAVFRVVGTGGSLRVEWPFKWWAPGSPRQPDEVVPAALLATAHDRGDAEAQYQVGLAHLDGDGVWRDEREAYAWFLKAARQGHAKAEHRVALLGVYDFTGMSGKEAFEWSMKSAMQGWPPAEVEVGLRYNLGLGVTRDDRAAVTWFRRAAEAGNIRGMKYLAEALTRGEGVPADPGEALHWQREAAARDDG